VSVFYKSMELDRESNMQFKAIKRAFKHGQSCRACGKKLSKNLMTIDHIRPVSDPAVNPFDMTNWQVLCLHCHRAKNKQESLNHHTGAILNAESEIQRREYGRG